MKVSIFSFAVNDRFPIDIMRRQFDKYMSEDFDFLLFNDAEDEKTESNINLVASHNKIKSIRVPESIHQVKGNPSVCYAATLNWAVHEYAIKNDCEVVALMHSDLFPICKVSISDIIGEYVAASTVEFRLLDGQGFTYFYPALTIINMRRLKNPKTLDFGLDPGMDCGGRTKNFIKDNANAVKFLPNHQISYFIATMSEDNPVSKYYRDDLAICKQHGLSAGWISEGFYHYMAGSQWNSGNPTFAKGHKERMELFLKNFY